MNQVAPFVILMVDDNPNNLFTLRALLKPLQNCRLLEADSGTKALARVLEHQVDLILLDIQMPGMDGFETAEHLQMTERTRHIPIIFITAIFKAEEFIRRGYAIGAIDYLTKPIDDNLLLNRIRLYQQLVSKQHSLERMIEVLKGKELALAEARDQALAANQAKSQFLTSVTHELNTPLNAVLGFAQVMQHDPDFPEHHKENLRLIWRNGQYLLRLINRILEITRLHNEEVQPVNEAFSLDELLTWLKAGLDGQAEDRGIRLVCIRDEEVENWVKGDARLLRLVLLNLAENAIKYSDEGEVLIQLVPDPDGAPELVHFSVSDQGPGIKPESLADIFEPFHQTPVGLDQGSGPGLGLHISREYVRLLGGELQVDSVQGEGSSFHFTLSLPKAQIKTRNKIKSADLMEISPASIGPTPVEATDPASDPTSDPPSHLGQLPPPLCRALHEAAISLDLDAARAILKSMREEHPQAARELEVLVDDFRFDRLAGICSHCAAAFAERALKGDG